MSILEMTTIGNPGWIGHSGSDARAAKAFCRELLGWQINDMPMQNGSSHAAASGGDTAIVGFAAAPESGGSWTIYFTVSDPDRSVAQAEAAGALTFHAATDVPGMGRMATLKDPLGARFALITYCSATS